MYDWSRFLPDRCNQASAMALVGLDVAVSGAAGGVPDSFCRIVGRLAGSGWHSSRGSLWFAVLVRFTVPLLYIVSQKRASVAQILPYGTVFDRDGLTGGCSMVGRGPTCIHS
jgi:hypothetical protein